MTHTAPQATYLKDYRPSAYRIEHTELTFELYAEYTLVHACLHVQRNNSLSHTDLPRLVLQGQELELLAVRIDQEVCTDYRCDAQELSIQPATEEFVLETSVRIYPHKNTALEGLYQSATLFCTQCEAEGFRKITYYLDRPDVLARFNTRVIADQKHYPILLSNGNLIEQGVLEGGRHWVTWQDPFPKPAYLFALVAGDLACVEDFFVTQSQRTVTLRIYVEAQHTHQVGHAMLSLKKAMAWDEQVYGREYDLDIFMIVAVHDFNMGAMENKGLNIFNASCLLADPQTATDAAYQRVEAVVAHEYFHNWSGNRVTCRDWFQLSLKEGFTVFRDAQFSADMNEPVVKRIEDVVYLRTHQFAEDASPLAHPVRPESYIEISNFYTVTIYEKGAEVLRMLHTLLGPADFRKGSDLYFSRHDGQAVTCDDFVAAMMEVSGIDLTAFKRWYSQAGTPELAVQGCFDPVAKTYTLDIRQHCPPTPGQAEKQPMVIPLALALLDAQGQALPLRLQDAPATEQKDLVLAITQNQQQVTFVGIEQEPTPSLLRGFSAPVKLSFPYSSAQKILLMQHDTDGFSRWEASQQLAVAALQQMMRQWQARQPMQLDQQLILAWQGLLSDAELAPALCAEMLTLPSEVYLAEITQNADVEAIHYAREAVADQLATALFEPLLQHYQKARACSQQSAYHTEAQAVGRRALQNTALSYLLRTGAAQVLTACEEQYAQADNMTERLAALKALVNSPFAAARNAALQDFFQRFKEDALVVDQWFAVQAACNLPGTLEAVQTLTQHPAFSHNNPNKVRALIGTFAGQNPLHFHRSDGAGYVFLADQVLLLNALNPQIAARLLIPLTRWRTYDTARQQKMRSQLERIRSSAGLSPDVFEIAHKGLC